MGFKFEQLRVWQAALDLTYDIHELTLGFPKEELFILTPQIKKAADSICLNTAEGSTGQSDPEQARFLSYAIRSGIEVVACLHIGKRRGIISQEKFTDLYSKTESLVISLQAMRKSIQNK